MKTFLLIIVAAAAPGLIMPVKADIYDEMLKQHNDYRATHNADPLIIDQDLMDKAQAWADHLADTTSFTHDYDNKYVDGEYIGENIASMGGTGGENGAIDATRMWYCELEDYKKNPGVWSNDPVIGHFTQVVWKNTKRVGFGIAVGSDGMTKVVANYAPGGNFNVDKPSGIPGLTNLQANVDMGDGTMTCRGGCENKASYCQPWYKKNMCPVWWFADECPELCETC